MSVRRQRFLTLAVFAASPLILLSSYADIRAVRNREMQLARELVERARADIAAAAARARVDAERATADAQQDAKDAVDRIRSLPPVR